MGELEKSKSNLCSKRKILVKCYLVKSGEFVLGFSFGFVMCRLISLGFLGLAGEHVIWAVGLVVIPFGNPGGGLEGETCEGALAL